MGGDLDFSLTYEREIPKTRPTSCLRSALYLCFHLYILALHSHDVCVTSVSFQRVKSVMYMNKKIHSDRVS
jgi:hypothetical protein